MKHKTLQFYITVAVLLLGIASYQICHITGPTLYPDEFGYWANAAGWLSFDWADTVALQSYYSFGYSIVLFPILKFFDNPFLAYRMAVLVNVLFVYLHAVLLWNIAWEWKKKEEGVKAEEPSYWYCLLAVFYPSVLFYMQETMTESLLSLLLVLLVWLLLRFMATGGMRYGILFILIIVYLHFVHMRTIGVLIAGIASLCYGIFQKKRKDSSIVKTMTGILALIALLVTLMVIGNLIKDLIQTEFYREANQSLIRLNDYSGRIEGLKVLLTGNGLRNLLISCIGKLFYLGIATLGSFYFGIWYLWKRCKKDPVSLFLLLSVLFTFGLIAASMMGSTRGDVYIYGRYNEFLIPVIIYLGLHEMSKNRYIFVITIAAIVLQGITAWLLVREMAGLDPVWFQGYFVIGISYVLQDRMPAISDYILYPFVAGSIAMLLFSLIMGIFIRRKKVLICYIGLFVILFVYTALSAGNKYLYDHSYDTGEDMVMVEQIKSMMNPDDTVLFIYSENDALYVDIIQFCLREKSLVIVQEDEIQQFENKDKAEFVLTYRNNKCEEWLNKNYQTVTSTYHFNLYCDPIGGAGE